MGRGMTMNPIVCWFCGEPVALPRPNGRKMHPECAAEANRIRKQSDPVRHRKGYYGKAPVANCEWCGEPLPDDRPIRQKFHKECFEAHRRRRQVNYNRRRMRDSEVRDRWNKKKREIYYRNKRIVFEHYGLKCICCGEEMYEFLCIDHINNDGSEHRKTFTTGFYNWLINNGLPGGFQTLCYNCNNAKGKYGKCPHQMTEDERRLLEQ